VVNDPDNLEALDDEVMGEAFFAVTASRIVSSSLRKGFVVGGGPPSYMAFRADLHDLPYPEDAERFYSSSSSSSYSRAAAAAAGGGEKGEKGAEPGREWAEPLFL